MSILENSIWPNTNGKLGKIKVQIPDGVTTKWPEGDAIIGNFVYNKGKLVGFVDTKALVPNDTRTTNIPYDYVNVHFFSIGDGTMTFNLDERCKRFTVTFGSDFAEEVFKYTNCKTVADVIAVDPDYLTNDIVDGVWSEKLEDLEDGYQMFSYTDLASISSDLSSLTNGSEMFRGCSNLTTFDTDLSALTNGSQMFEDCSKLTSFTSDLSSLTNGYYMFSHCDNLSTFTSDLGSLTDGNGMFYYCSALTTFTSNLSALTNGQCMFNRCAKLTSFTSDLSSLTNGISMFCDCSNLASFTSNLSSLTDGNGMFMDCTNLTSFTSDLSSLTDGTVMFQHCDKLTTFNSDLSSLTDGTSMFYGCVALTTFTSDLSSLTDGNGMFSSCKLDTASVQQIADTINAYDGQINVDIANTTPNTEETEAFNTMASKGWTVYVNGSSWDSSPHPYDLVDETTTETPIPFYAKPIEVEEDKAKYVGEDGKFYNILGAQFIYGDDLSTYGMFLNEEDAAANMRLTKIVKKSIEE